MRARTLLVALLLVSAAVLAAATVTAQQDDGADDEDAPLGTQVSAFVQSTDASTAGTVDDGVFEARLNRTDDESERATLLERRSRQLENRTADLETRVAELEATNETNPVAYYARASGVAARLHSLQQSANVTERHASASGVDPSAVRGVRDRATELQGREVARVGRDVGSVGPPPRAGPPDGGPPHAGPERPGGANASPDDPGAPEFDPTPGDGNDDASNGPDDVPASDGDSEASAGGSDGAPGDTAPDAPGGAVTQNASSTPADATDPAEGDEANGSVESPPGVPGPSGDAAEPPGSDREDDR